jgi:hypothetical protein
MVKSGITGHSPMCGSFSDGWVIFDVRDSEIAPSFSFESWFKLAASAIVGNFGRNLPYDSISGRSPNEKCFGF